MSAQLLLDRVALAYRRARSYRDRGVSSLNGEEIRFETAFSRRGSRLRLAQREHGVVTQVLWGGERAASIWSRAGAVSARSIAAAVWEATLASHVVVHYAAPLLLAPSMSGLALSGVIDPSIGPEVQLASRRCLTVRARRSLGEVTLAIDAGSLAIVRVEESWSAEDRRSGATASFRQVTTFDPEIDGPVDDRDLTFDPPKAPLVLH